MGKQKFLKPAHKLKDCIEKTHEVELQSSNSELYENSKEDICLIHAMLEELNKIIKRFNFYIELIQILTQSPFRKKNKRIWCLEPLCNKEQSLKKRSF